MRIDISDIAGDFPDCRVAVVIAEDLAVPAGRAAGLAETIGERENAVRAKWAGMELSEIPGIAAWRRAYRAFGIRRTSYRSSVERLMKNVLAGRALPTINGFVDAYNAVSLTHVLPAGADDLDRVQGDIAFRYARSGDSFRDMAAGDSDDRDDPPKAGEVVYADAGKVLCRRWNWRQDARSLVAPHTRRAVITLQSNGWGDPEAAAADLIGLLARFCGARCALTVVDANDPERTLAAP
jgi:DNA/RNA-binding domain of Phe-tRNA-synthetase-like protein